MNTKLRKLLDEIKAMEEANSIARLRAVDDLDHYDDKRTAAYREAREQFSILIGEARTLMKLRERVEEMM